MNYIDLFHGIGGFALSAYMAGMKFENHYCSDVDKYCRELYALRFPDSVQLGDIREIDTDELKKMPGEWIISGGFPCQDISVAGKGAGIEGDRSGLWFEYRRIISELRPRFAIMENVGAITFRGLDQVLGSLAEIGYNAEWQDIRASDVGARHKRERIWIVAYPNGERGLQQKRVEPEERGRVGDCCKDVANACGSRGEEPQGTGREKRDRSGNKSEDVPHSNGQGSQEREGITGNHGKEFAATLGIYRQWWRTDPADLPDPNEQYDDIRGSGAGEVQRERSEEAKVQGCEIPDTTGERLQVGAKEESREKGIPNQLERSPSNGEMWGFESRVGRVASRVPGRVGRLKGLGNSIVPQIAAIIFRRIKKSLIFNHV